MRVRVGPCARKGLRRDRICRCFARGHVVLHPHRSRSRCRDRPPGRRRSALRHGAGAGRAAAAAAAAGRLCRPGLDRGLAAALDRQRESDLGTAHRGVRSVRPRRGAARAFGQARARRPVGAEDSHAQSDRQGHRSRRPRSARAGRQTGRRGARRADRGARHRPLDRRHLSSVLPRPCRRLAGRRPRVARGDAAAARARDAPDRQRMGPLAESWRPWRGAAACMLWAYYRTAKQRDGAPIEPAATVRR